MIIRRGLVAILVLIVEGHNFGENVNISFNLQNTVLNSVCRLQKLFLFILLRLDQGHGNG